jgi:lysine-ketoglutarate reductase/saccharopine dehydrogenase-like protein (TIGR00300 family)
VDEAEFSQIVEVEGHLIDSMILSKILDEIMDQRGEFEFLDFKIGKRKNDYSSTRIQIIGRNQEHLNSILNEVFRLGATTQETPEVQYKPATRDMTLPDDFYSTSNHPTSVYLNSSWVEVEDLMMDKQIVIDPERRAAVCKPIGQVRRDDLVVTGERGIRIKPPERPREGVGVFEFMNSHVSSEKPSISLIKKIAEDLRETAKSGGKIAVVAGPAVIHTGAAPSLAKMVELGYVDALLSGNALAVHDIEYALYGTSLGVELDNDMKRREPRNHIAAINEVNKAGSIKALVDEGRLRSGIFYQLLMGGIPYVLAGSIRDDGPIPEVVKDAVEAQRRYKELVRDVDFVLMLASTLHSIAVGNMLRSSVKIVCVDINPAVVTKLSDRGTSQAVGLVSDVGVFLPLLVNELEGTRTRETRTSRFSPMTFGVGRG